MGYREAEAAIRMVAGGQHWVVTRAQARQTGATWKALRNRLRAMGWEPMSPQVLRLLGSMPTFEQQCMAAALDSGFGAVASKETAARIWQLPGFRSSRCPGCGLHPAGQRLGGQFPRPAGRRRDRAPAVPGRPWRRRLGGQGGLLLPLAAAGDRDRQRDPSQFEARRRE